ncbi:hypothetical protein IAT38_003431 [Cryptococcus sp. DSM 104549]
MSAPVSSAPSSYPSYASRHIPVPLKIVSTTTTTRAPTPTTLHVFYATEGHGIRVVHDSSLNGRLKHGLDASIDPGVPLCPDLFAWERAASTWTDMEVGDEAALSSTMQSTFWLFANNLVNQAFPEQYHGLWQPCRGGASGASDWQFKAKGECLSVVETKLPTVLTAFDDPDQTGQLEKLLEAASGDHGMIVLLVEEDGALQVRVVDENGIVIDNMAHWARGISQLWEQALFYKVNTVAISSYEYWLPIQRDPYHANVIRIGSPINRRAGELGVGDGLMTPLELSGALLLPPGPIPRLPQPLPALPVTTYTQQSLHQLYVQLPKRLQQAWAGEIAGSGVSGGYTAGMTKKRKGVEDSGNDAVLVRLACIAPQPSPLAKHLFFPRSFVDSDLIGLIPVSIASPHIEVASNTPSVVTLTLAGLLGSGHLSDTYTASLGSEGVELAAGVCKITLPGTYHENNTQRDFNDASAATAAFYNEVSLYRGALSGLQGDVVPRMYGVFEGWTCAGLGHHNELKAHLMMLEYAGPEAASVAELRSLSVQDRLQILEMYQRLHVAHVLHRDIQPRHIRRRRDGRFIIIDFEHSHVVQEGEAGAEALAGERRVVMGMLGLGVDDIAGAASSAGREAFHRTAVDGRRAAVGSQELRSSRVAAV